jgi:penicillin-binding protein 2
MLGFIRRFIRKIRRKKYQDIDPDEIFLDSKNLPSFNVYQFEGRLERAISPKVFSIFSAVCLLVALVYVGKLWNLQVTQGTKLKNQSENNMLRQVLIVAPRGSIISRNGVSLVWNESYEEDTEFPLRHYIKDPGFGIVLGFVKYPTKDKNGYYYEEEFTPKDGSELMFDEILRGRNGIRLIETSADGEVVSENTVQLARAGEDVVLSVDSRIQTKLFNTMKELAERVGFKGGAAVILDVESGEILAITSYPEYDPEVMANGDTEEIKKFSENPDNPFLNRAIAGLYTPGSIVKPFLAFAALEEGVISPYKEIVSTGRLVVPNPYNPDQPTIFKDWKAHGAVDMRRAISVSSDVYFYQIGGGFEGQRGLGISNIKKYLEGFGFTKKTGFNPDKESSGTIPDPEWKEKTFGEIWRIGDTYNTSIGQYGMQITPLQAAVAVAALANGGKLVIPSLLFTSTSTVADGKRIDGKQENLTVAKEGMRLAVKEGTASGLNIASIEIAGKTGTAELGARKQFVNSWVIGFFPYDKPKYAFAAVMERGPVYNLTGATYVMRQLFDWMTVHTPEYFKI